MNVKVSITLPLDQVPHKAGELLEEQLNHTLGNIEQFRFTTLNKLLNGDNPGTELFNEVHLLRTSLFLLDSRLAETEQLISSWMQHKLPKQQMNNPKEEVVDEEG